MQESVTSSQPIVEAAPDRLKDEPVHRARVWYHVLFVGLLVMFAGQPLMAREILGVDMESVLFAAVLLGALAAVSRSRGHLFWGLALAVPAMVLTTFSGRDAGFWFVAGSLLAIAFLILVIVQLLKAVVSHRRVTSATISGALCAYLLLPLVWVFLFDLAEWLQPGSFRGLPEQAGLSSLEQLESFNANLYYFSLVTITTLGYGDITPVQPWAQVLATLEAVLGQLFLVVLVARLVGLQVSSPTNGETP